MLALALAGPAVAPMGAEEGREPTIEALLGESGRWHGRPVTVRGEAIGDLMIRGETGWLNISDGEAAVGIRAPADMLGEVRFLGRYNTVGDLVSVSGFFYAAGPGDSGGAHIRAESLSVLQRGDTVPETISPGKFRLAFTLLFLTLPAFLLRRHFRKAGADQPGQSAPA